MRRRWWLAGALALALGCGMGIGRDLRDVPPTQVVYDDACKVQGYHDAVEAKQQTPPRVTASTEFSRSAESEPKGGVAAFAFENEGDLVLLRKFLSENYVKVPKDLLEAPQVEVRVKWAEKAGLRRVVTTEDAQISYGGKSGFLPYHICLSELLFGAPLYKTRRDLLGIAPAPTPSVPVRPDAGFVPAVLTVTPDAGASPDSAPVH